MRRVFYVSVFDPRMRESSATRDYSFSSTLSPMSPRRLRSQVASRRLIDRSTRPDDAAASALSLSHVDRFAVQYVDKPGTRRHAEFAY
jgi:hypothetical protein